jgi:peptidoglycan/LPS O-acetylase OafA/YrhL
MWALMDILRGVAALWVFLYHVHPLATSAGMGGLSAWGYLGVWMFFVISGYCVTSSAERTILSSQRGRAFLWRRLVRIFPPFWLSLAVIIALPFAIEMLSAVKTGAFHSPDPAYRRNGYRDWLEIITLSRDIVSPGKGFFPPSAVYWTLAIEVQFYLVLFVLMFARRLLFSAMLVLGALAVAAGFFSVTTYPGSFIPYWPAFIFGAVLLRVRQRGFSAVGALGAAALPLGVIGAIGTVAVVAMILASVDAQTVSQAPGLVVAAATALFAWFAEPLAVLLVDYRGAWRDPGWRSWLLGVPVAVGTISYSLYLLHGQLYQLADLIVRNLPGLAWPVLHLLAVMALTTAFCGMFFVLGERPFILGTRKLRKIPVAQLRPAE